MRPIRDGRSIQLPNPGRITRQPRSQPFLAGSPLISGEHQPHPRGGPLVQEFLSVAHGRQEANGNSGQPGADQTPTRTLWPVILLWKRGQRATETAVVLQPRGEGIWLGLPALSDFESRGRPIETDHVASS